MSRLAFCNPVEQRYLEGKYVASFRNLKSEDPVHIIASAHFGQYCNGTKLSRQHGEDILWKVRKNDRI